jgi:siroheme synthase-like protein
MSYYPINLNLQDRSVLVVGGGKVAQGKTEQLLKSRARITLVSPDLTERLGELAGAEVIHYRRGEFTEDDLNDMLLVISATNCQATNERVARAAAARGLLCNVVDQPALCNFITPAVVERGRLQISISTGGGSPSLAQRVKREVGLLIGEEYGDFLEMVAELRGETHRLIPDYEGRRRLLQAFVESEALELLRSGRRKEAEHLARTMLEDFLAQHSGVDAI